MNSKRFGLVMLSLLLCFAAPGQTVIYEKTLQPADGPLGMYSGTGIRTVIAGSGTSNNQFTPAIEFADLKNDGFIVRRNYRFTKYNEQFEVQWEKEIDKVYGLGALPMAYTVGNSKGVYFIQEKRYPSPVSEIHIIRFDREGNIIQTRYDTDKKIDDIIYSCIDERGLHLITSYVNKKEKKVVYSLISFSAKDLSHSIKIIPLDYNDYEIKMHGKDDPPIPQSRASIPFGYTFTSINTYTFLRESEEKITLHKSYFRNDKEAQRYEMVCKTADVSLNGTVSNIKSFAYSLPSNITGGGPTLILDEDKDEMYIFGYINNSGGAISKNGIFLCKYNYSSSQLIFSKIITFNDIKNLADSANGMKYKENDLKVTFNTMYNIGSFKPESYYFDRDNHTLTLFLLNSMALHDRRNVVTLSSRGEITDIEVIHYRYALILFPNYRLTPKSESVAYSTPDGLKPNPINFINQFADPESNQIWLWRILTRNKEDYNIMISVKEANAEIKTYKISRK